MAVGDSWLGPDRVQQTQTPTNTNSAQLAPRGASLPNAKSTPMGLARQRGCAGLGPTRQWTQYTGNRDLTHYTENTLVYFTIEHIGFGFTCWSKRQQPQEQANKTSNTSRL